MGNPAQPRSLPIALLALLAAALLAGCGTGDGDAEAGGAAGAEPPAGAELEFTTDFSKRSVPLDEFLSGGPPKDGIPPIDEPKFIGVAEADAFLSPREPVAILERGGEVHAYPIQILMWHEIVNDELGGDPVAMTYCPLCNSTVAFLREVDGRVLDFGTTGRLRKSDLVMYDRQTESWWQQLTAEAVVGELVGTELEVLPAQILPWKEVASSFPDADVLSRDTGFDRDYGSTPYVGYDDPGSQPFALRERADDRLRPKELVTAVRTGDGSAVVYPLTTLEREAPVSDRIDGRPVVISFQPEVASALDTGLISEGRAVGAGAVFSRELDGRELELVAGPRPGTLRDRAGGSVFDAAGMAVSGPLEGSQLERIPADNQFWFALAAFFPDAEIRG